MTTRYDFRVQQGSKFAAFFVCSTDFAESFDLSGYTAEMQVRQGRYGRTIDKLTTENGRLRIDLEKHAVYMELPPNVTSTYPVARLLYDLEITSVGGEVHRLVEGEITVSGEITR